MGSQREDLTGLVIPLDLFPETPPTKSAPTGDEREFFQNLVDVRKIPGEIGGVALDSKHNLCDYCYYC